VGKFLPEFHERRQTTDHNGPAVSILGNCTAQSSETFTTLSGLRIASFHFLSHPQTSHLLQALDLSLFAIPKCLLSRANQMEALNVLSSHIAGIVCSFMGRRHSSERGSDISQGGNHGGRRQELSSLSHRSREDLIWG
jgi:hypothetical protein